MPTKAVEGIFNRVSTQRAFLKKVAGVDGCKAGWLTAVVSVTKESIQIDAPCVFELKRVLVAGTFTEVLSKTCECELVCIDIPIGLSNGPYERACDLTARKLLGQPRGSSVFPAPLRPALVANDRETASRITLKCTKARKHGPVGVNRQTFSLFPGVKDIDDEIEAFKQDRIREVHPEISFWALNDREPMQHKKRKLAGRKERMKLLAPIFLGLEKIIAEVRKPKEVAPDDILDALAAAWTAGQVVLGRDETLPENPEFDSKGLRMEILCPTATIDN